MNQETDVRICIKESILPYKEEMPLASLEHLQAVFHCTEFINYIL